MEGLQIPHQGKKTEWIQSSNSLEQTAKETSFSVDVQANSCKEKLDISASNERRSPRHEHHAQPAFPCLHLTKDEHDSCDASPSCQWNDQQNSRLPAILTTPFSRTGNIILRHLARHAMTEALSPQTVREALKLFVAPCATENSDGKNHDEFSFSESGVPVANGKKLSRIGLPQLVCKNLQHGLISDLHSAYIDMYVAHWWSWCSRREDAEAADGYSCSSDTDLCEEIYDFYTQFHGLRDRYRILDKVGEGEFILSGVKMWNNNKRSGTFSSVYKAVDRMHSKYKNCWCACDPGKGETVVAGKKWPACGIVAVKRIYETSAMDRIENELKMIKKLTGTPNISGLVTAMRFKDQVVAVLPFYEYTDFKVNFTHLRERG
ncbi:hypothetical protein HDU82_006318 [Entophlyctis luteolus]|nr:hypothetical protein HDU82_006318 [Entophlyctis luteolus]